MASDTDTIIWRALAAFLALVLATVVVWRAFIAPPLPDMPAPVRVATGTHTVDVTSLLSPEQEAEMEALGAKAEEEVATGTLKLAPEQVAELERLEEEARAEEEAEAEWQGK
ncbi:hypothetical protein ACFL59_05350 [Planctomycetota bacterium]